MPVKKMFPFPTVVEIVPAPPVRAIPFDEPVLSPPVPCKVMLPPPFVLMDPPVKEIPWAAPLVPPAAMMSIALPLPVAAKFALEANPTPAKPFPWIESVAVTDADVVKAAPTLIPSPPPEPPEGTETLKTFDRAKESELSMST